MTDIKDTKEINILGISGSPRPKATDYAVQEALKYAQDKYSANTRYFSASKKKLNFCIHCDYCIRTKEGCIHKDDISSELYEMMEWADAWVIGTPVYQGTVSGQTKVMMDRCRAILARDPKLFKNKVGMAIADGGDRVGGQEPAIQTILNFYVISEMIPVGGGSFGANLGGTFWSKDKGAEGIIEDEEGMKGLRRTMDNLVAMTAATRK